ncbi:TIGR04222 domain-containing membrane protein [Streptomyces lanatus]|uniref:TIGR04222 domain-containing membrane protein n=1 Tax=Streptomyces lanatus TaxID=66900 RepID=A0ABV1XXU8_9ACTN|nr:TIGR04222 domain-containing membrane protein [Streptomyces lanatus]GHG90063.1 membrane protein [Streptomyces lanatus]
MFWVLLLLLAWAVAGTACTRLCLAAVQTAAMERKEATTARDHDLTLYEAAFLSGGPRRVADLTLVSMARQQRLLLAHTGWATVVDPRGRDEMERSVIGAIGPEGQSRIEPVRDAAAAAEAVGSLADRLVSAGLAVPDAARDGIGSAIRQVRLAAAVVLALGAVALLAPAQSDMPAHLVALWFALPFVLTLSCLAIARVEIHPYAQWASPAGQRLLSGLIRRSGGGDDRTYLTFVAVRGVRAVGEPELRAAFAHRAHGASHWPD